MAAGGNLRTFATKPLGRVVLIAIAIVALAFGLIYLSEIIGIAILLLFGLALPIYMGWKRPRGLAIAGIVILLLAAPIASILVTQGYFQPPGRISSYGENGGDILQNATVSPFNSGDGSVFQFHVTVVPSHLYKNTNLTNVTLFVTTCPDATLPNESTSVCTVPFPWYRQVHSFNATPTAPMPVTFAQKLPGPNLWWWTVWATYRSTNATNTSVGYAYLNPNNGYANLQGPVVGDFFGILGIVIVPVYIAVLLYPGIAFYGALAFYTWFKAREARRKALAMPPEDTRPAGPGDASGGAAGSPAAGTRRVERSCPNCGAVVYANETQCWKCGKPLTASGGSSALPSSNPPTP